MFEKLRVIWEEQGYEILLLISVTILIIYAITRVGQKGTW